MKNRTSSPDCAHMVMITNLKRILPLDTSLHHLNQCIDLVFCETSPESDFCKFKFGASLKWFPWPSCIRLRVLGLLSCLIRFERNEVRDPLCIWVILNLDVANWGAALRVVVVVVVFFCVCYVLIKYYELGLFIRTSGKVTERSVIIGCVIISEIRL